MKTTQYHANIEIQDNNLTTGTSFCNVDREDNSCLALRLLNSNEAHMKV